MKQSKFDEAIIFYNMAIKINLEYTSPLWNKGNALAFLGRHTEANEFYQKAILLDKKFESLPRKSLNNLIIK